MSAVLAIAPTTAPVNGSMRAGQTVGMPSSEATQTSARFHDVLSSQAGPVIAGVSSSQASETSARFHDVLSSQAGPVTAEQNALEQELFVEPLAEAADEAAAREFAGTLMMLQHAEGQPTLQDAESATLQDAESALTLLDPLANTDLVVPAIQPVAPQLVEGELLIAEQKLANEADQLQQQLLALRQAPSLGTVSSETLATVASSNVPELLQSIVAGKMPSVQADVALGGARGDAAIPLYALVTGQPLNAAANAVPSALPLPPADAQATFEQALDKVVWMAREGLQQARLQLQPAHLGRIDIVLDMEGTEARLLVASQQPQVRDALESLMPRLRESLAEQGITLADASVADSGKQAKEQNSNRNPDFGNFGEHVEHTGAESSELQAVQLQKVGLLDLYV